MIGLRVKEPWREHYYKNPLYGWRMRIDNGLTRKAGEPLSELLGRIHTTSVNVHSSFLWVRRSYISFITQFLRNAVVDLSETFEDQSRWRTEVADQQGPFAKSRWSSNRRVFHRDKPIAGTEWVHEHLSWRLSHIEGVRNALIDGDGRHSWWQKAYQLAFCTNKCI